MGPLQLSFIVCSSLYTAEQKDFFPLHHFRYSIPCTALGQNLCIKYPACHSWSRCNGIFLVCGPNILKQNRSDVTGSVFVQRFRLILGIERRMAVDHNMQSR